METTSPKNEDDLTQKIKYEDSLNKNWDNLAKKRRQPHWYLDELTQKLKTTWHNK